MEQKAGKLAVQAYTLRDWVKGDVEGMFRKIAEIGYKGIEFAGFYDKSAAEIKTLLERYGLKAAGSHVGADALRGDFEEIARFHAEIGCGDITVPWHQFDCDHCVTAFAREAVDWAERLKPFGIRLSYHNHEHEFVRFTEKCILDDLLLRAPELYLELDTCWCWFAGYDPVSYVKEKGSRCVLVHLKDAVKEDGKAHLKPLGDGELDIAAIAAACHAADWLIVENDQPEGDAFADIEKSYRHLISVL